MSYKSTKDISFMTDSHQPSHCIDELTKAHQEYGPKWSLRKWQAPLLQTGHALPLPSPICIHGLLIGNLKKSKDFQKAAITRPGVVAQAFNPSSWGGRKLQISVSSGPAWPRGERNWNQRQKSKESHSVSIFTSQSPVSPVAALFRDQSN